MEARVLAVRHELKHTVALLHALSDRDEANILAMMCCTSSEWGAPCLDALNTYYGRPNIPVGTLRNLARLLESEPDQHSPLGGRDLVAARTSAGKEEGRVRQNHGWQNHKARSTWV
jgi:hypothetical protein